MADVTDVANALVTTITAAIYPGGTSGSPVGGVQCKVFQGWPDPKQLLFDSKTAIAQVSVFPTGMDRVVQTLAVDWPQQTLVPATVAVTVSGTTATVSGAGSASSQNIALIVDGTPFVYAVQAADTATSIATALAALVNAVQPASSAGAVVTIPGCHTLVANVGSVGFAFRMLRRQQKRFQVTVWAGAPSQRDPLAAAVDVGLALTPRMTMPDGSIAMIRYAGCAQDDGSQKAGVYLRHLMYDIDYATTQLIASTQVVATLLTITGGVVLPPTGGLLLEGGGYILQEGGLFHITQG